MILLILLGAALGGLSVIFVLQNNATISVTFLTWQFEGSLSVVLFLAMMSGIFISLLVLLPSMLRDHFHYTKLVREKKTVEDELYAARKTIDDRANRPVVVEQGTPIL